MFENVKLRFIKGISPSRETKTYDIEIDSELHAFVVKNKESDASGVSHNSACICLTNLSDDRMRVAKSGQWWNTSPQRALANISVAYTEKPDVGQFMEEWLSLYNSKAGERGIFNRVAAVKKIKNIGRRQPEPIQQSGGINPCVTGNMIVDVIIDEIEHKKTVEEVVGLFQSGSSLRILSMKENGEICFNQITNAAKTKNNAKILKIIDETAGKFIRVTEDHLVYTKNRGFVEAKDLVCTDELQFDITAIGGMLQIQEDGYEDVYDFTVPATENFFINNILVHNCGEIVLRSCQFCNLSEVIIRPNDTLEKILDKVRIATIIGTHQATLTNFRYLRSIWKKNTEEERLLGVSLTGIMDHDVFSGKKGSEVLAEWLTAMKECAIEVNKDLCEKLDINQSVGITTVKPSGCTTLNTKVKTTEGIKSMAEIFFELTEENIFEKTPHTWIKPSKDMFVFDENNEKKKITNLFINGISEVYEIEDEAGNTYKFTAEHKLKTTNGWKRVDALTEDDEIVSF